MAISPQQSPQSSTFGRYEDFLRVSLFSLPFGPCRARRADVGGLVYHVLNSANARAPLFDDEAGYRRFTALLAEERQCCGMRLLAWCLMPNYWHLVLWPRADGDLGRFVRRLTQRHTQAWHGRHGTRGQGHLYQGRYKAFLVQDDAHLVTVCRYVERNPLRAGPGGRASSRSRRPTAGGPMLASPCQGHGQQTRAQLAAERPSHANTLLKTAPKPRCRPISAADRISGA